MLDSHTSKERKKMKHSIRFRKFVISFHYAKSMRSVELFDITLKTKRTKLMLSMLLRKRDRVKINFYKNILSANERYNLKVS